MNRQDIEKKAQEWVDTYPQSDDCTYTQEDADCMIKCSFIQGAEWMQEQKDKEIETSEAYLQKTEKILTEKCDDVDRLIRENQKLQEEKEQMIEKACSFLSQHLRSTEYQGHPNNDTFLKSWFMACIKQVMKGE